MEEEVSDAFAFAAWARVIARMRWVVPEVWRRSTSWSPSPRRCCRTAAGLCRAYGSAGASAGGAGCDGGVGVGCRGLSSYSRVGFPVAVAGGGTRPGVCQQGHRHQLAGAGCRVLRPWLGLGRGGGGGVVWGWHCWWGGGRGRVLCRLGVWASLWIVWMLRECALRSLLSLAGCLAKVWVGGGRMDVRVGLWSVCNGWLLVVGARWYGVWVGGLLVVLGRSTRSWCCWCACAAPRGSMGVYRGSCVVGPCGGGHGWCWTAWWWCCGCAGCVWYPSVGGCGGRGWWWWYT